MSCNYAEGLSHYEHKGKLGLPEKFDTLEEVDEKVKILAEWLKESGHTVFHTGAGISTSAGIPDFRGPNGVWTLEKKGLKPDINISFDDAKPTLTHMAIKTLEKQGKVGYVITQNIDGLHLRSGLPRNKLSELHGNMFVDKCNYCNRLFVRDSPARTVGLKTENLPCPGLRTNGRKCRGKMFDTILDWEDGLPDFELDLADMNSCIADLSICLGTTLQIVPSGNLPVHTKKRGGKLVICNLQPTKQDRHADLIINYYVDYVLEKLLEKLNINLLSYKSSEDPVCTVKSDILEQVDWSIPEAWVKDKELNDKVKNKKIIKKRVSKDCRSTKKVKLTDNLNGNLIETTENNKLLKHDTNNIHSINYDSKFECDEDKIKVEEKCEIIKRDICNVDSVKVESDLSENKCEDFNINKNGLKETTCVKVENNSLHLSNSVTIT